MSKEIYLSASIYEKASCRLIAEFDLFCDFGDSARAIANVWCDILEKYKDLSELYESSETEIPQTALREMTSCLYSFAVLPEACRFEEYELKKRFRDIENRGKVNDIPYKHKPDSYEQEEWDEIEQDKKYSWDELKDDEEWFLQRAQYLRKIIYMLDSIHFENTYEPVDVSGEQIFKENCFVPDSFIKGEDDLKAFKSDPQAYEWKFGFFNTRWEVRS